LIGRTAVHSGKDPAFVAYDQFLSTGILQPLSRGEVRCGSISTESVEGQQLLMSASLPLADVKSERREVPQAAVSRCSE
jgi:hypothetical protein